ncbi:MAG: hypothetical protein JRE47_01055 [Deltaproteobacteria bacterium]|nr:hypothetical protein [Deltaproteobacteria bacterium]
MTDLSKDILQKIKEDKVRPYSKGCFLFRRSVIGTSGKAGLDPQRI